MSLQEGPESHRTTVPGSPGSIQGSPSCGLTSFGSSIGSKQRTKRRALPSLSAIAAAQTRPRQQQSEDEQPTAPSPEARTIRDLILDKNSGIWSKSALHQRKYQKKTAASDRAVQLAAETAVSAAENPGEGESADAQPRIAPQVRILDGKIVLDQSSLTFALGPTPSLEFQLPVLNEDRDGPAINAASFRKNRIAAHRWDRTSTEKFYSSLSKYGTDFETISRLFPSLNRRHIKNKFKLEERQNPHKVDAALLNRKPIDLDDFPEPPPVPEDATTEQKDVDEEGREIVYESSAGDVVGDVPDHSDQDIVSLESNSKNQVEVDDEGREIVYESSDGEAAIRDLLGDEFPIDPEFACQKLAEVNEVGREIAGESDLCGVDESVADSVQTPV